MHLLVDDVAACKIAARLLSEHGENPEYDRAISELMCEFLGLPLEASASIQIALRRLAWSAA